MSISTDQNSVDKEFNKLNKYKDLEIEICRIWNLRATTVPVIVGALVIIKRAIKDVLTRSQENHKSRKSNKLC